MSLLELTSFPEVQQAGNAEANIAEGIGVDQSGSQGWEEHTVCEEQMCLSVRGY